MVLLFRLALLLPFLFFCRLQAQKVYTCRSCDAQAIAEEMAALHGSAVVIFKCPQRITGLPEVFKWGIADAQGRLLLPPQWDSIGSFHQGLAEVFQYVPQRKRAPLKAGLVDASNRLLLPLAYRTVQRLQKHTYQVNNGKGWLIWNLHQGFLSAVAYDSIQQTSTLPVLLYTEGFCHRLDTLNQRIDHGPYREWQVADNGRVYPIVYDTLYLYRNGMKSLIPLPADSVIGLGPDEVLVYRNGHALPYHFISEAVASGQGIQKKYPVPLSTLLDSTLIKIRNRSQADSIVLVEDWYLYRRKNLWGYGDTLGNIGIGAQYEALRFQYNKRLAMKYRGKWGFLDDREKFIVQPYYDEVGDFLYQAAWVRQGQHYNFVNLQGKLLSTHGYDSLSLSPGGNYLVRYKNAYGLVNPNGREIIGPRYRQVLDFGGGSCLVQNEQGSWYLMNYSENRISPHPFSAVHYLRESSTYVLKK